MMHESVLIKVPSEESYFKIIRYAVEQLAHSLHFHYTDTEDLIEAVRELFDNTITHAYKDQTGIVEVAIHPFAYGIRVDLHDWGLPMAADKYAAVPIDLHADKGFNRVYKLVDLFEYNNLGKNGKKFSVIKYLPYEYETEEESTPAVQAEPERMPPDTPIEIRNFEPGDEEAIARLIYQNYGYSYIKEAFYYPKKILAYQEEKLFSVVAVDKIRDEIVGHFALTKMPDANIAEVGVVVVNPLYKGMGIMNRMFNAILERAQALKFDAVFGEAIMYHIYSQKSNLSHGFHESAMLLGRAPEDVTIEHNDLTQKQLRGSVLVAYKIFHYPVQQLTLPTVYRDFILKTYRQANLPVKEMMPKERPKREHVHLYYNYDPLMNVATIVIDHYGKHFKHKFLLMLAQLRAKHCDMIYAEINLHDNPHIDKIVKLLNKRGFFYAGVLYLRHKDRDYLCLQNKHTTHVGRKNLVCYSKFCNDLLTYIYNDEQRIKGNLKPQNISLS